MVSCKLVHEDDEVMMVTQNGIMIRTTVEGINCIGRNTQGVRVINVDSGDRVIDMTRVVKEEEVVEGTEGEDAGEAPVDEPLQASEETSEEPEDENLEG